jgi:hypothetical protein
MGGDAMRRRRRLFVNQSRSKAGDRDSSPEHCQGKSLRAAASKRSGLAQCRPILDLERHERNIGVKTP